MAWYDVFGDIAGGIGGAITGIGGAVGRAGGWVGGQLGGIFDGQPTPEYGSLARPVDLEAQLAQSSRGGSLLSRAADALGDVIEDVVVPLGGRMLGQVLAGPTEGWPGTPPIYVPPGQTGPTQPRYIPGAGSVPAPIGGPATPLPSPVELTYAPTIGAWERSQPMLQQAAALPGGAALGGLASRALQALGYGAAGGAAVGAMGLVGNGAAGALFRPGVTTVRPARVIVVPHPETGAPVFFGHLGRPLLFSRDLSAARKVDRLARRARRTRRGR